MPSVPARNHSWHSTQWRLLSMQHSFLGMETSISEKKIGTSERRSLWNQRYWLLRRLPTGSLQLLMTGKYIPSQTESQLSKFPSQFNSKGLGISDTLMLFCETRELYALLSASLRQADIHPLTTLFIGIPDKQSVTQLSSMQLLEVWPITT